MNLKKFKYVLLFSGVLCLVLSVIMFCLSTGGFSNFYSYGGDAYTGIQNASAAAANNVQDLSGIVKTGFGFVLLASGVLCLGSGLCIEPPAESRPSCGMAEAPAGAELKASAEETAAETVETAPQVTEKAEAPEEKAE